MEALLNAANLKLLNDIYDKEIYQQIYLPGNEPYRPMVWSISLSAVSRHIKYLSKRNYSRNTKQYNKGFYPIFNLLKYNLMLSPYKFEVPLSWILPFL